MLISYQSDSGPTSRRAKAISYQCPQAYRLEAGYPGNFAQRWLRKRQDEFFVVLFRSSTSLTDSASLAMGERRALCRQPDDHHFGSLIMPAVTAGAFLLVTWVATKALSCLSKSLQSLEG